MPRTESSQCRKSETCPWHPQEFLKCFLVEVSGTSNTGANDTVLRIQPNADGIQSPGPKGKPDSTEGHCRGPHPVIFCEPQTVEGHGARSEHRTTLRDTRRHDLPVPQIALARRPSEGRESRASSAILRIGGHCVDDQREVVPSSNPHEKISSLGCHPASRANIHHAALPFKTQFTRASEGDSEWAQELQP